MPRLLRLRLRLLAVPLVVLTLGGVLLVAVAGWDSRTVAALAAAAGGVAYVSAAAWVGAQRNRGSLSEPLRERVGLANQISLARGAAIPFVFAVVVVSPRSVRDGWIVFGLYAAFLLADLADGFAARRRGEQSLLGRTLENEADSLACVAVGLSLVAAGTLPWYFLFIAGARYLFVAAVRVRAALGMKTYSLRHSVSGRLLAAALMNAMLLSSAPIVPELIARVLVPVVSVPLMLGFVRDFYGVSTDRWLLHRTRGAAPVAGAGTRGVAGGAGRAE
jgi:phosphatidylglycerophosphate synthase